MECGQLFECGLAYALVSASKNVVHVLNVVHV